MTNPKFISDRPLTLTEVKAIVESIKKRDIELNPVSNRLQEYLDAFVNISLKKKEELRKKLFDLNLTRIKEEHITKIVDFLPTTTPELKTALQAYPLTLVKKDQDSIVAVVKEFV